MPGIRVTDPKPRSAVRCLKGVLKPAQCKLFGRECTPEHPVGRVDGVVGRVVRGLLQLRASQASWCRFKREGRRHGRAPPKIRFRDKQIEMAHGAGGKASRRLIEGLFAPMLFGASAEPLGDAAHVVPPTVTLTAPANGSLTNDTTPTITGTADNATGDSSTVTVKIYSGTSATGDAGADEDRHPLGHELQLLATAALAQGTYTAVATQTDTSSNTGTSNANTFTVDTTAPTATKFTATNTAGGPGRSSRRHADLHLLRGRHAGVGVDRLGAARAPPSTSSSRAAATTRSPCSTTADAASIKLGSVATNADYVTTTTTFNATIAMSSDGTSVIVTLGTPSNVSASASPGRNMSWTPSASVKDLGRQRGSATAYNETNSDVDF